MPTSRRACLRPWSTRSSMPGAAKSSRSEGPMVREITPLELKSRREAASPPVVLDVREDWELAIASLPNVLHIPMDQIESRLGELDPTSEIVVMCRAGGRSMQVARFLERKGFRSALNLAGGILAWGRDVDPTLRAY